MKSSMSELKPIFHSSSNINQSIKYSDWMKVLSESLPVGLAFAMIGKEPLVITTVSATTFDKSRTLTRGALRVGCSREFIIVYIGMFLLLNSVNWVTLAKVV